MTTWTEKLFLDEREIKKERLTKNWPNESYTRRERKKEVIGIVGKIERDKWKKIEVCIDGSRAVSVFAVV